MTFSGIIQAALPEQSGTSAAGKTWRRRDFILLYDNSNAQYPKTVLFSVMGDNIEKLNIQQGQEYDLEIDFSTREHNGRVFMSATCWKATARTNAAAPVAQPAPAAQPAQGNWQSVYPAAQPLSTPTPPPPPPAGAGNDPLPF